MSTRNTAASKPGAPPLPRTLWYMGVKARVLPGFLDEVLEAEVPGGGTVVDLMSGTAIVSAFCAHRWRVFANDVQAYAQVIAKSFIEHDPARKEAFADSVDPRRDLDLACERNLSALEDLYAPALAAESLLLSRFRNGDRGEDWCREYRQLLEEPEGIYASPSRPGASIRRGGLYARARDLIGEPSIARYREAPQRRPACLAAAYYANVYFGLHQALVLDSLRAAMDEISPGDPFAAEKRTHYLSALLHTASISTSGTSHFAQPRHLTKDTELEAMAGRRLIDVRETFEELSREILATVRATDHSPGNQAFCGDYRGFLEDRAGQTRFVFPAEVDLVYLDPPYTLDHYSRFYHALEVLARYDYPELERDARGQATRGRYPRIEQRFQSDFCRRAAVEGEFRRVIQAAAGAGAKLVISYSSPTGLLLKTYLRQRPTEDPIQRLEALCGERYRTVTTKRLAMTHSGQGEPSRRIEELLVVCKGPKR